MILSQEQAAAIFEHLPTALRAEASMRAIGDPAAFARYVAAAVAAAPDRGIYADESGQIAQGDPGADAEATRARIEAAAADPAAVKKADKALKALLTPAERAAALVHALYAGGFALQVGVVENRGG